MTEHLMRFTSCDSLGLSATARATDGTISPSSAVTTYGCRHRHAISNASSGQLAARARPRAVAVRATNG